MTDVEFLNCVNNYFFI